MFLPAGRTRLCTAIQAPALIAFVRLHTIRFDRQSTLFTGCHFDDLGASLAFDVAAPLELAFASFLDFHALSCETSAAAHLVATIRSCNGDAISERKAWREPVKRDSSRIRSQMIWFGIDRKVRLTVGILVAFPAFGAEGSRCRVESAVVGTLLQEYEVVGRGSADVSLRSNLE